MTDHPSDEATTTSTSNKEENNELNFTGGKLFQFIL
jgi:hypothetical protein